MTKNMTTVRKTAARKQIVKELQALKKMEHAFVKARVAIESNSQNLSGDTYNQIVQIFNQLGIAVTVTDTAVQDKAHALAQTFVK